MTASTWNILHKSKTKKIKLKIDEIADILLSNRGIKTKKEKEEFLNPKLENVNFKSVGIENSEVKKSLTRIKTAIEKNEKIIIYGDYDVDGITGTAILWETLYKIHKNTFPYIPQRIGEGYGLSIKGIDNLVEKHSGIGLIITVDNGIVANDAVSYAKEKGIDVIVTDHHAKAKKLPDAFSIVHTTSLCGAGVAYLLAQELRVKSLELKVGNDIHLELVALATIADLVPLRSANRTLVEFGLNTLRNTKRPGLQALFDEARINKKEIDTYHIGHIIAPRLNAAGRIGSAMDSLRLLCTTNDARAKSLAHVLSETNRNRQTITLESAEHASLLTGEIDTSQKFIVISNTSYNEGVIGLVASRLVEKHYRPTIVIAEGEKHSKGSARSIAGFNIIEFIREFRHLLIDAGGHPMAAGFTIETEKITMFKNALIESSAKIITDELLARKIDVDMELDFDLVSPSLYENIQKLAPFGMGNPTPTFLSRGLKIKNIRIFGKENNHVELLLVGKDGHEIKGILFNGSSRELKIDESIDAVYKIAEDNWNGRSQINLNLVDFKIN